MRHASRIALAVCVALCAPAAFAGAHTWDVWEVFTNASGTVQFVELREANGTPGEVNLAGRPVVANPSGTTTTISSNVPSPTSNKSYLIATAGFAALPGAPTPNLIKPTGFLFLLSDTSVTYSPYDTATWSAGSLPTDGVTSLQRPGAG